MATIERAISIRQPYVEQILLGKKNYEYRSTLTHIREMVYLYASKKPASDDAEWRRVGSEPGNLPTGVIVGSIVIAHCEWSGKDNCFRYRLESPVRFRKHLTPSGYPFDSGTHNL